MRAAKGQVEVTVYTSGVDESVSTESEVLAKTIAWADMVHEKLGFDVYALVKGRKSGIFGFKGSHYMAYQASDDSSNGVLERARVFRYQLGDALDERLGITESDPDDPYQARSDPFWRSRALFALENFKKKGFKTVTLQQFAVWTDGKEYGRAMVDHDYLPVAQEEIVDRFCVWMNSSYVYENTSRVTLDGKDARTFEHDPSGRSKFEPIDPQCTCATWTPDQIPCLVHGRPHECAVPSPTGHELGGEWTCACGIVWVLCKPGRWQDKPSETKKEVTP